jgi:4-hydroxy-3-methylbut-2-enyl diphosphate reductase IspH
LREAWFEGAQTVGVTAGTSTPDVSINEIEEWLHQLAARWNSEQPTQAAAEMQQKQAA